MFAFVNLCVEQHHGTLTSHKTSTVDLTIQCSERTHDATTWYFGFMGAWPVAHRALIIFRPTGHGGKVGRRQPGAAASLAKGTYSGDRGTRKVHGWLVPRWPRCTC